MQLVLEKLNKNNMKKTQKEIAKSLLSKIDWIENHAWEVVLLIMLAGPFLAMPIEAMIRGYSFDPCQGSFTMRDTPSAIIVSGIGALLFIVSMVLSKIMKKKLIKVYSMLPRDEQSEVQWIDGWQYWNT